MRILRPEYFIAMKVFAIKNDPSRTFRDMADIRFLMSLADIDREEVKGCFKKHGLEELYEQVSRNPG